jgi:hypothetical protein
MSVASEFQDNTPRPLIRPLPPAKTFPIEALEGAPGRSLRAIERVAQVPLALAAQSVLATFTMAVQAHANVVLPFEVGGGRPLSCYFIGIGESGERKTTADNLAIQPIKTYEQILADQNRALHEAFEEAKREGDKSAKPPIDPTVLFSEPTQEAFLKALARGQPSVGIFSSEGGRFLGGYSMKPEEALKTLTTYSELWDGGVVRRERATEGAPIRLEGRRVTMSLLVQPSVSYTLLGNQLARDQGLLSRVLFAAPASRMGTRLFRETDSDDRQALAEHNQYVMALLSALPPIRPGTSNELRPRELPMAASAKRIWVSFHDEIERELTPQGSLRSIAGLAAKLAEHAGRLAGVLAVVEDLHIAAIQPRHMEAGIALARFYGSEAERLFGLTNVPASLQTAQRVLDWILCRWAAEEISLTQLYQSGPREIRTARAAAEAASVLEEHGWLAPAGKRRRTPVWRPVRG